MADTQTIHDYAAASAINAAADYLLIDPASTGNYLKINRNTLLGITGSPLGNTDIQTVLNKTLGVTNTITVKDSLLTLQNASDLTKQVNFSLASITTGTTRTLTLPNRSDTLATLAGTENLTNKTFTSPVITGGSIDNTTITVDSISGHTSGPIVTVGGVQLNNGTIGTANAVVTASIADTAVTPAKLQAGTGTGWASTAWTPAWTNLTAGNGTNASKYIQIGKHFTGYLDFTLGNTSSVSGNIIASLPVTLRSYNSNAHLGNGLFINTGTAEYPVFIEFASTTTVVLYAQDVSGTYSKVVAASSTIPFTWGTGSRISATIIGEVA